MMNRILKRPMFRMGGRSDDGIMSLRPGYENGGSPLTTPDLFLQAQKVQQKPFLTLEEINKKYDDAVTQADQDLMFADVEDLNTGPGSFFEKQEGITQFLKTPEGEKFFKKPLLEKRDEQIAERKSLGLDIPDPIKLPETKETKKSEIKTTTPETDTKVSDKDTIDSYIKMFSEAFGDSPEDASRERYLQLAKFGANLLAQPGGDLVGAIGKAAAPSIEGLAASEAARRAGDREVKLAAVKTAIEKMDDPTADKIKTLARIAGVPEEEVAKLMITGSGDSKMDRIETTAKALATTVGEEPALKIAQVLEEEGAVLAQASPIEIDPKTKKPKEGVSDGYYYDESGKVYKVEDGKPSIVKIK
jgi:hypothetical protein